MDNPEFERYSAEEDDGFEIYCAFTTYELLKKSRQTGSYL